MAVPRTSAASRLLPADGHSAALSRLTGLASRLLSGPGGAVSTQVSLLTDVQTVVGGTGLGEGALGGQSTLADSLCTVTVDLAAPLVVAHAVQDHRVSHLPPVTSGAVGAYLGVPLVTTDGHTVGALCAFASTEREWSEHDLALLHELAQAVLAELELQALAEDYRADRSRWELATAASGIGTFAWDLRDGRLEWDERMLELFGYRSQDFTWHVGEAFARVHAADLAHVRGAIDLATRTEAGFFADYRVVLPGGRIRWLSSRGRALLDDRGVPVRLLGTTADVTEVRTARDEAARLLENMATGFLSLDDAWRVSYLNLAGAAVVGYSPEALVGRVLWEAFPGLEDSEFGRQYKHVADNGETAEFEAYYEHLDQWFEVRAICDVGGLSLYFLDITARRGAQARAAAANERLELIARVSAELASAGLDGERAVARLAQFVLPLLADWCVVTLVEGDRLHDVGSWHRDPDLRALVERYVEVRLVDRRDLGYIQETKDTGRMVVRTEDVLADVLPQLGNDEARELLTALDPWSLVNVPLLSRGTLIGVLTLIRTRTREAMSPDEITTAREIASRAGLALENARLYAAQRNLAEALQRSLLTTPPQPDHCEIVVRYTPAAEVASVGGDWFDSFLQSDGATVLVIGDVMGHDTEAAAAMGQVRSLLRGIAWHTGSAPAEVLSGLDAAMQGLQVSTTASAVVARLEQSLDELDRGVTRLRWSNAGHPPPIVINPDGSVLPLTNLSPDLLLGIDPGTPRGDTVTAIDRGATVLLYTDGLVERRDQDLDEGLALLRQVLSELAHLSLDDLCDQLLVRMQPDTPEDDVAIVAVRLHRQDRARPAEAGPQDLPAAVPPDRSPG